MRDLFFYALCAVMLGLAITTVLARNLFRAALALLGVLLCTAILFLLLRAEMVALVQVMVYIGGIMIFVLYAVLLTSELGGRMASPSPLKIGASVVVAAIAFGSLGVLAKRAGASIEPASVSAPTASGSSAPADGEANIASLKNLGARLLDPHGFLIPFELVSVLLLAAMVGAIAVAREGKGDAA
ncbi:MAG: nuoJ 2 [Fibrobacteres bacterium]|nr:nuoJ 2 [Fibrobacterota bacterium]